MKEKEKLEIIRNILKEIKDSNNSVSKKTVRKRIKIEEKEFATIFKELEEKEFVRTVGKGKMEKHSLTDKGFSYLSNYNSMIKFIDDFRL